MNLKAILCATILSLPSVLSADVAPTNHLWSLGVGGVEPLSEMGFSYGYIQPHAALGKFGYALDLQYLYQWNENLGVGFDGNYSDTTAARSEDLVPFSVADVQYNSAVFLAVARINFASKSRVIPYGLLGIGVHRTRLSMEAEFDLPFFAPNRRDYVNDDVLGAAFAAGLGTDFFLSERWFVGVEARYQNLAPGRFNLTQEATTFLGPKDVKVGFEQLNFFARVGYKYGGPRSGPRHGGPGKN